MGNVCPLIGGSGTSVIVLHGHLPILPLHLSAFRINGRGAKLACRQGPPAPWEPWELQNAPGSLKSQPGIAHQASFRLLRLRLPFDSSAFFFILSPFPFEQEIRNFKFRSTFTIFTIEDTHSENPGHGIEKDPVRQSKFREKAY